MTSPVPVMAGVAGRGLLAPLRRMLERRIDRDGQASALDPLPRLPVDDTPGGAGRRNRQLGLPEEILDRSLSQKVLDGWLQNRHQVLVPMTFRLARLAADEGDLLLRFTAVVVLNASTADAAARHVAERWLGDIGAKGEVLAPFRAALDDPPALSRLLAAIRDRDLAPYAYAAAVAAVDIRDPVGRLFASYVAARLVLPADAVRSIDRRYRR